MKVYLDASVIVPYFIEEETSQIVSRFILAHDDDLHVGTLASGEVGSAISRLVRTQRMSRDNAVTTLDALDDWLASVANVTLDAADVVVAASFVRRFDLGLRMPDALHAATCLRLDLTLATFDKQLVGAARQLAITTVVPA